MQPTTYDLTSRVIDSPVGRLTLVASDDGLAAVLWPVERPGRVTLEHGSDVSTPHREAHLDAAAEQLGRYFEGSATMFDIPLDLRGTDFQVEVWQHLITIEFGETQTYSHVARALGRPKASRAVGAAVGRNPVSIIVPCHRVMGASGSLTGFAGGIATKRALLDLEQGVTALPVR